jgi:phage/plasmid-like protein (TIGR03299 family)
MFANPLDVDTMVQVPHDGLKGTPWEKVGTALPKDASVRDTLVLAGLDWGVHKHPLAATRRPVEEIAIDEKLSTEFERNGLVEIPEFYSLLRSTDLHVLSPCVGSTYKPIQNDAAFQVFQDFVLAGNMTMETAGSLKKGQHVWGLAAIGDHFELADGEVIKGYFLLVQSHKYGHSLRAMFTPVRYPGALTLVKSIGVKGNTFRMSHNRKFDENRIKEIKQLLGIAKSNLERFVQTAKFLQESKLTQRQAVRFLGNIFKPKEDAPELPDTLEGLAATSNYGRTLQNVASSAPGFFARETPSCQGTAWGYYNLVANYFDTEAGRTVDNRLESAWFGANARKKAQAFEQIKAFAIE